MKYEKSCGVVVFTRANGEIRYLLISSLEGIYGFPKGHMENDETETETALREVYEETGLKVKLLDGFRTTDSYPLPKKPGTVKQNVYFLGTFEDQAFTYQREELSGSWLFDYETAMGRFQFEGHKRILKEANDYLLHLEDQ